MKKMSDVFELPLAVFDDGHTIVDSNGFHAAQCDLESEAESIIMAINMHDELVDALDGLADIAARADIDCPALSDALKLLERCK